MRGCADRQRREIWLATPAALVSDRLSLAAFALLTGLYALPAGSTALTRPRNGSLPTDSSSPE